MRKIILTLTLSLIVATLSCNGSFSALLPNDLGSKGVKPNVGAVLLSEKVTSEADKEKRVVLTVHGYTATPFENQSTIDFLASKDPNYLFSRVMLGAHGVTVEEFEKSTWQDWEVPLEKEIDTLNEQGYKNVSLIGTSTGAAFILEILSRKDLKNVDKIVLIAPLVEFSNKLFQFVELIKLAGVRSIPSDLKPEEIGNWYRERPLTTLVQIKNFAGLLKTKLSEGIKLPSKVKVLLIQSLNDDTVDPASAAIIRNGVSGDIKIMFVDSKYHIMTVEKSDWTDKDRENQKKVFDEIYNFLK